MCCGRRPLAGPASHDKRGARQVLHIVCPSKRCAKQEARCQPACWEPDIAILFVGGDCHLVCRRGRRKSFLQELVADSSSFCLGRGHAHCSARLDPCTHVASICNPCFMGRNHLLLFKDHPSPTGVSSVFLPLSRRQQILSYCLSFPSTHSSASPQNCS